MTSWRSGAAALLMTVATAGGGTVALAATPVTERPYAGLTLHVLSFQDLHARSVQKLLPEFERSTGAHVQLDAIASSSLAAKIGTDQAAGGSYDLYTVDEPFLPQMAPFFRPYKQWSAPVLEGSRGGFGDFLPATLAAAEYQGVSYGLPVSGNVYMYVYRKDLFSDPTEQAAYAKRYGYALQPPQTTAQMHDVAEFFTRPPHLYGFAPFTKLSEGTTVEALWILATFGVAIDADHLQAHFAVDKAAAAFAFYKDMMRFAPPGAANWHHAERMSAYSKGHLAQLMTWPNFLKDLEDPTRSLVVGKSAYDLPPAAAAGRRAPMAGSWVLVVPKSASQPRLAAEFAHWWAAKQTGQRLVPGGMNPARSDLLKDPGLSRANPWFPGILANFERALVRPRTVFYRQVSEVLSVHFTELAAGQITPAAAAAATQTELAALIPPREGL